MYDFEAASKNTALSGRQIGHYIQYSNTIHELFQDVIKLVSIVNKDDIINLVSIVNKDDSIIRQTELFLT